MGLSATQARFLGLTKRRGDIEYEVQQINLERLKLSETNAQASEKYQDAMNNRKLIFSFNNGQGVQDVDISYNNYKNYMNQQLEGLTTSQDKYYLVSSSGNKLVVASEAERDDMIKKNTTRIPLNDINEAKTKYNEALAQGTEGELDAYTLSLAKIDLTVYESEIDTDENGNEVEYYVKREFHEDDFIIVEDLDNTENFQNAIKEGVYYFAKYVENESTNEMELKTLEWSTLGGGAISEILDTSDDAAAQAEYEAVQDEVQTMDKKLEMRINELETEREAIQTEMDSVKKIIEDNIEGSFTALS